MKHSYEGQKKRVDFKIKTPVVGCVEQICFVLCC